MTYLKYKPQADTSVMNNNLYIQDVPLMVHKTSRQSLEGKEQTGMKKMTELVLGLLLKHRKTEINCTRTSQSHII